MKFSVELFTLLLNVVLTFETVVKILPCCAVYCASLDDGLTCDSPWPEKYSFSKSLKMAVNSIKSDPQVKDDIP